MFLTIICQWFGFWANIHDSYPRRCRWIISLLIGHIMDFASKMTEFRLNDQEIMLSVCTHCTDHTCLLQNLHYSDRYSRSVGLPRADNSWLLSQDIYLERKEGLLLQLHIVKIVCFRLATFSLVINLWCCDRFGSSLIRRATSECSKGCKSGGKGCKGWERECIRWCICGLEGERKRPSYLAILFHIGLRIIIISNVISMSKYAKWEC